MNSIRKFVAKKENYVEKKERSDSLMLKNLNFRNSTTSAFNVIKSGWLIKRNETFKTWNPRYFVLLRGGYMLGFQRYYAYEPPKNLFIIQPCEIISLSGPAPYGFMVRGIVSKRPKGVERRFLAYNAQERQTWIVAIRYVASLVNQQRKNQAPKRLPIVLRTTLSSSCSSRSDDGSSKVSSVEDYIFLKVLGKGTFGKVFLCEEKSTGNACAVKIVKKDNIISRKAVGCVKTELRVLKNLNHPFIISLKCTFQTSDSLYYVMEYASGGELYYHAKVDGVFSESKARFYASEIILALGYLHKRGIIYRDLKPSNILLDKDGHVKLVDFGISKDGVFDEKRTESFCGTPLYMAPEIIDHRPHGTAVDWWCLGITIYYLIFGKTPFFARNKKELYLRITTAPVNYPRKLTSEAQSLIDMLLIKNPDQRLGSGKKDAKEIMRHQFFCLINWRHILEKKIEPPHKPEIAWVLDTRCFNSRYTEQSFTRPSDSRIDMEDSKYFTGFSYNREES